MPAHDRFHDAVRHALEKEGWTITHDPLSMQFGTVEYYIDLGAEYMLGAEKQGEKIAVEIKSFLSKSALSEFHTALGQYIEYLFALAEKHPGRMLFLAVPVDIHETFFEQQFIRHIVQGCQLYLLVYDEANEVIVTWKK